MLPNDIARCEGDIEVKDGIVMQRKCCVDCKRKVTPGNRDGKWYIIPSFNGELNAECEYRIEP